MTRVLIIGLMAATFCAGPVHAGGDATKGAVVFRKCQSCHSLGEGQNRVGPTLFGVVGRQVAALEAYRYSEAMRSFGSPGKHWDEATLAAYLQAPRDVVPGTRMAFAGLRKPEDIADIIAYLKDPAAAQ